MDAGDGVEPALCLDAPELAADLVVRPALALEQHDTAAGLGQVAGGRGTGEAAAGNGDVPAHAEPATRKVIASALRPGPKATAQPRWSGWLAASIRASTNITVADDMLP